MEDRRFLRARISSIEVEDSDLQWLINGDGSFVEIDFLNLPREEIDTVFDLYTKTYSNPNLEGGDLIMSSKGNLSEYNRWVLFVKDLKIIGFALYKSHPYGLKLGLTGQDGSEEGRSVIKQFHRKAFNILGVFGEVSPPIEKVLEGFVPKVNADLANEILNKTIEQNTDGLHYYREINPIGRKRKILVGRPFSIEES